MRDERDTKVYKRFLKFGKRNQFCRFIVFPVLFLYMILFRTVSFFGNNRKRFAMLLMSPLLVTVYSSFSFPMFIDGENEALNEAFLDSRVFLAQETQIDPADMEILEDEDVLDEDEAPDGSGTDEISHGMHIADKYAASEILESSREREQPAG